MVQPILRSLFAVCALLLVEATATGQLIDYNAVGMTGLQVVPPNASPATGTAYLFLNTATRELSWTVESQNLIGNKTSAHFHGPAAAGANGPVQVTLGLGNPTMGSQILTVQQVADLQAGKWYVDVHTTTFPGAEIRGQLTAQVKPWVSLGYAVTGSNNKLPRLDGNGPLTANSANSLVLGDAKPNAQSALFVGLTAAYLPFKGGALVPTPTFVFILVTNAQGGWTLPFNWPAGVPLYTNLFLHVWIKDPSVFNQGLSASNALRGTAG